MKRILVIGIVLLAAGGFAQQAQPPTVDVLGLHNLSPGSGASVYSQGSLGCTFCHAPHSGLGGNTPLWNQKLSQKSYVPYNSSTDPNQGHTQPTLGVTSSLCLSCHDGTVAIGNTAAYGQLPMVGSMNSMDSFGTTLTGSHPFSLVLPMKDAPHLVASLVAQSKTADVTGKVKLIKGNVECTSCHDPHVQNTDKIAQNFLALDGSNGQLCLACHDPNRAMQGKVNPLAGFTDSVHRAATNQVAPDAHAGPYPTVGVNACISCHTSHNSQSPARLLRPAVPAAPAYDPVTQDCMTCHGGGTSLSPTIANVMSEVAKVSHPLPAGNNFHDAAEPIVLNNSRHASCVDCHNPHGSKAVLQFSAPPAIRPPQAQAAGVSATDGTTPMTPAVNQYETCLRCHGTSIGKQTLAIFGYPPHRVVSAADPLNIIPQLATISTSSHPVMHPRSSPLPQPSLLVNMLNLAGLPSSRLMETQLFCTDCHNSDDNREFGGTGPNGPHGSRWTHLLERRYEFSQAAAPGGLVTDLYPNPDVSVNGPYAMCGKCHDLANQILANTSFRQHQLHVAQFGFSCSVCHAAHGMGGISPTITGERLVNFDANVVAQNGSAPIAYNRARNTCTLMCHQVAHNPDGTITAAAARVSKGFGDR
jgi:predicted CXXCH cytochrome family protein